MINWRCSICGKKADYHVCVDKKHKYYCTDHWFDNYIKGLDRVSNAIVVDTRRKRKGTQTKRKVKK